MWYCRSSYNDNYALKQCDDGFVKDIGQVADMIPIKLGCRSFKFSCRWLKVYCQDQEPQKKKGNAS